MRDRFQNDFLLIIMFILSFILIRKAFNEFSVASISFLLPSGEPVAVSNTEGSAYEKLIWKRERKLSWDDLKGEPDPKSFSPALTYSSISYSATRDGDSVAVTVNCIFNKERSWVKQDERTPELLHHEQGHFDLNEVFARKFRQALKKSFLTQATLSKDIQKIYERYCRECLVAHRKYDQETVHSATESRQDVWDNYINVELSELAEFEAVTVKAPLE